MIVSSIPRSGSTKFCIDLAEQMGYTYYDEMFDFLTDPSHKQGLHQIHLDTIHPDKSATFLKTIDFDRAVINNHEMNFFILKNTDIFLTRQNVQDAVWSYVAYITKYLMKFYKISFEESQRAMVQALRTRLLQMKFFYDYCVAYEKTMTIPDLTFTDSDIIRNQFKHFKTQIEDAGSNLNLPKGLIYQ